MGASEEERLKRGAAADVKGPDALRGVHFVAGDREQVAADPGHVDGKLSGGLDGVGMEVDVGLGGDAAYFFDRLDGSRFVVGEHDADELGVAAKGAAKVVGIDDAVASHGKEGDLDAAVSQPFCGVEDGVVLDGRGDEVVAGIGESEEGEVIAFGASACEDDLGGAAVEQGGDGFAGVLDGGAGVLAVVVDGGGVAEVLEHVWAHRLEDLGVEGRGSVGVHVDAAHGETSPILLRGGDVPPFVQ